MQFGRLLPHCLIALCASGCASDRYTGSIGRDGAYTNRGYGFTVLLTQLEDRWAVSEQIRAFDSPIDVDGDGLVEIDETRRIRRPTLKLESKTSSAAINIDVAILGKNNKAVSLDGIALIEIAKLEIRTASVSTSSAATSANMVTAQIGGFPARVVDIPPDRRLALIDVDEFIAEESQTRRQIISVMLRARVMTAAIREDFESVLRALVINRRGGSETQQEKW